MAEPTWQSIASDVQDHRDSTIARVKPPVPDVPHELPRDVTPIPKELLTAREVEITESAPEDLVASLAHGKLRSVEVTNAFLRRAGLAQKLGCLSVDHYAGTLANETIDQLHHGVVA